jgi:hypothetical protein
MTPAPGFCYVCGKPIPANGATVREIADGICAGCARGDDPPTLPAPPRAPPKREPLDPPLVAPREWGDCNSFCVDLKRRGYLRRDGTMTMGAGLYRYLYELWLDGFVRGARHDR